jgi:hypothetical protein
MISVRRRRIRGSRMFSASLDTMLAGALTLCAALEISGCSGQKSQGGGLGGAGSHVQSGGSGGKGTSSAGTSGNSGAGSVVGGGVSGGIGGATGTGGIAGSIAYAGNGGTGGSARSGTGGAPALSDLFSDPAVPACQGSMWKLEGTAGADPVTLGSGAFTSNIQLGTLYVVGVAPGGGVTVGDAYNPLILKWDGSLTKGSQKALTGGRFLLPGGDPAMPHGYCIAEGDFGPAAGAGPGVLFKFRIRSVKAYASSACTGEPVAAQITGCMFRSNDLLP